jgi:putative ABC transport system permease protein
VNSARRTTSTPEAFIAQFDGIIGGVGIAAIAISCLGLLVGGIGVMNIVLVSVTERTKIDRSDRGDTRCVVFQFLLEAMTLTASAGLSDSRLQLESATFLCY